MEFTLLFAALTGAAGIWAGVWWLRRTGRIGDDVERPGDVLTGAALAGLVVGRVAAMLLDGVNPITNPADALIVRAGVDTGFASIGAIGALAWSQRRRLPEGMDVLAPAALTGLAGWHAGCLWRGTCLGTAADLPWAWSLTEGGAARHPVELYTALLLVTAAISVARLPRRPWLSTGAALVAASAARLVTQPLRPTLTGGPVWWYAAGIGLGAAAMLWGLSRRRAGPAG